MKIKKIFPFEGLVLGLLFIILIFVGTMGFYTYKRLNSIVLTISNLSMPDNRLGIMKDILNDLYRSEISVKSYRLTKDNNYLVEFYLSAKKMNSRMELLQEYSTQGDSMYYVADSIRILIEQEYIVLESLLKVKDEYRVKVALDKAMETVDKNISTIEKIEAASVFDTQPTEAGPPVQEVEEKTSFFRRIFGSSKRKNKQNTVSDSVLISKIEEPLLPDTVVSNSNLEMINRNLAVLSQKETTQERLMNIRELKLIKKSELNMQQIRNLVMEMEIHQMKIISEKSKSTEDLAREIKNLIALFTFTTVLLILLAAVIIIIYVRKNNQYKKVLRDAKQKAEELANEKERFLASMSHEIRTPMNAIIGYTEQLLHSGMAKEQLDQLEIVNKAGKHLVQIINEVLDYSKMQAGKTILKKENFLPHVIILEAVQLMVPQASNKNIQINYSSQIESISVIGDSGRFRQILLNLLSNAIKYTEQGEVRINAMKRVIDNRRIQLDVSITDTGIGMSADFLKKVFDEFERADIVVDKTDPGSGLGLAITKKLIHLHHGKIHLKSEEGKGTTVKITLPYLSSPENKITVEPKPGITINLENTKFLIVDDVDYNRRLIATILKKYKATFKEAKDGQEAINLLNAQHFNIILMDLRMPLVDGLTATKVIRKTNQKVKILMITASTSEEDKKEFLRAGVDKLLIKPVGESELLEAISVLTLEEPHSPPEILQQSEIRFNLDELWKMCQFDKVFFNEMLDTFIKTGTDTIKLMKTAFSENNIGQVSFLAHRLSGPAKHIGAHRLMDYLKKLENIDMKDFDDTNILIPETEKEFNQLVELISKYRNQYQTKP